MKFQLIPGKWYACELIGDEFEEWESELRSYSPIRIKKIITTKKVKGIFELHFYHANYPEGVRDKVYSLQIIENGSCFLLARSIEHDPHRLLLVYDISIGWLGKYFGVNVPSTMDVETWLNKNA